LFLSLFLVLVFSAAPATADTINMDYTGFAWETGGLPSSMPGDVLELTAIALTYDPAFNVSPGTQEVTLYIWGLTSLGETLDPYGNTQVSYTGGHIEVYEDSVLDHDWGINPPNGQQSTFTNGALLFEGDFTDFWLALAPSGIGAFEGNIDGVGGTAANICDGLADCAYTFGGAFDRNFGPQLPEGYDLQIEGTLEVLASVPANESSFGAIKSLYRQ
jgi:hypothetical protein